MEDKKLIIILTGPARVGKDTYAGKISAKTQNGKVTHYAFGDHVKNICMQVGWNRVKDEAGRHLLQDLAECVNAYNRRSDTPLHWTSEVLKQIVLQGMEDGDIAIIKDARHDHEILGVKQYFGQFNDYEVIVLRLERKFKTDLTESQLAHVSEQPVSESLIDEVIKNQALDRYRNW